MREHVRYKVALNGMLTHNGNQYQGNLIDFSVSGCGFTTLVEPEFAKGAFVKVESTLNRFISADNGCHIASVRKMPNGWFVGISFEQEVRMTSELKRELLELSLKRVRLSPVELTKELPDSLAKMLLKVHKSTV